jgi:hypothetical protein
MPSSVLSVLFRPCHTTRPTRRIIFPASAIRQSSMSRGGRHLSFEAGRRRTVCPSVSRLWVAPGVNTWYWLSPAAWRMPWVNGRDHPCRVFCTWYLFFRAQPPRVSRRPFEALRGRALATNRNCLRGRGKQEKKRRGVADSGEEPESTGWRRYRKPIGRDSPRGQMKPRYDPLERSAGLV